MQPAPKGKRFAAYLIDALIISLISMVISLIFAPQYRNFMYNIVYYNTLSVITFIVFVLYFTLFECGSMMGTPGKSLMGIVVVDIHTNERISFGKALGRALGHYVSAILCIGYIIGLCDENGLALHDRMSGTFVAVRGSEPVHVEPRVEPRPNPERRNVMNPKVICVSGEYAGRAFTIPSKGLVLGRDHYVCDVVFKEARSISRTHCKIEFNRDTNMFVLYDIGSSYGTFLGNGTKVSQGRPVAMQPGDDFYLVSRNVLFRTSL